jgi:hypothetical protein
MRFILVVLQMILAGWATAQEALSPPLSDIGAALSGQQHVPPTLGAYLKSWVEPVEPFKIVGPIYYVGTKGLAAYLITTRPGTSCSMEASLIPRTSSRNRSTNLASIPATSSYC